MATPSSPTVSSSNDADVNPNHQMSASHSGTSTTPTPANSVGGGSGIGDKGFLKGNRDTGHISARNPQQTIYNFLSLENQKAPGEQFTRDKYGPTSKSDIPTTHSGEPTCEGENHDFMGHKPGQSNTLPGWEQMKHLGDKIGK